MRGLHLSGFVLAALPVLLPGQAFGQTTGDAAAPQGGIQEIIVTAQKRSENLQDVPISVTAFSADDLQGSHALSIEGLNGRVPNAQVNSFPNAPNSAVFTIRGIGVIEPDPYAGNTVSIVVDGVPQYFSMGALVDVYDVERVEILRGPQGTLFGANTTGGAVNIITNQPTGTFGGTAELTYGNWGRIDARAAVDFPITDGTLAGKVAVAHSSRDGWITNAITGDNMDSRNVSLVRGYLDFTPTPNFDATLILEYNRARNGSPAPTLGAAMGDALYQPAEVLGFTPPCADPNERCRAPDRYFAGSTDPNTSNLDGYRATLTMNLAGTPIGDLTAITGFRSFRIFEYTDNDNTPVDLLNTRRKTKGWQLSQELRTDADISDAIKIVAGAFYMKTHYDHLNQAKIYFAGDGTIQVNRQDQDNYSLSGFAQTYIDLTDSLRLQAGLRYTHEKTSMLASMVMSQNPSGVSDYFGTGNVVLSTVAPPRASQSWDNVGWKVGLDYQATDNLLLYGYWARGFKSGGFTGRLGIPEDIGPYGPEKVDTFEAGFKSDLLDRRVRFNLAAFYTDYRNMQLASIYSATIDGRAVVGSSIINAASATIKGAEAELQVAPIDGLNLKGSLAYLDASYSEFPYITPGTLEVVSLAGNRLQNAPEWAANLNASYEFPVGGSGIARVGANYAYTASKYLTAIVNQPNTLVQPTHLVDANLDVGPDTGEWTLGFWVNNLFDKRYIYANNRVDGFTGFVSYGQPRQYGLTFKTNW